MLHVVRCSAAASSHAEGRVPACRLVSCCHLNGGGNMHASLCVPGGRFQGVAGFRGAHPGKERSRRQRKIAHEPHAAGQVPAAAPGSGQHPQSLEEHVSVPLHAPRPAPRRHPPLANQRHGPSCMHACMPGVACMHPNQVACTQIANALLGMIPMLGTMLMM